MEVGTHLIARDKALAEQDHDGWWERYSIRAGVEATMSELKRGHGLGKLRVRRMPRVRLAVGLKITACNVKRWLRSLAKSKQSAERAQGGILVSFLVPYALLCGLRTAIRRSQACAENCAI